MIPTAYRTPCRLLIALCFIGGLMATPLQAKIYIGRIVDTVGSTLPCDMTIDVFEGTGTTLAGVFTFTTSALCTNCNATNEIILEGSLSLTGTTAFKTTISGEQNTVAGSTITRMTINAPTQALERRYVTVSGISTIGIFSITTYVTLTVVGNNVSINGTAVPAGTYELIPNQVFP